MAQLDSFLTPEVSGDIHIDNLATATSSAAQAIGRNKKFGIVGTGAFHMKRGDANVAASVAADFLFPANQVHTMYTGTVFTNIRVFNDSGGNIDVHIIFFANT